MGLRRSLGVVASWLTWAACACSDPQVDTVHPGPVGGAAADASAPRPSANADARAPALADAAPPAGGALPSDVLELASWKLTLPVADDDGGGPREVLQPELAGFALPPYFHFDRQRGGVVFRAHAGGVTTDNSGYPRSELREMQSNVGDEAAWSTNEGAHTLELTQAITHLPDNKRHVVAGQIHDDESDLIMIRLEDEYLFVEGDGDDLGELDPAYAIGTRFTVKIAADASGIRVYYQDMTTPKVVIELEEPARGCYFKAGAYTQSDPERDAPDAYGEVVVYDLQLRHE
jgi:poly(beta-D-mannuronate) lyase